MTTLPSRVLIVDDDPEILHLLKAWFEEANFEVTLASDGDQAFGILNDSEAMDLVLTDFMMPERNGLELVRLLRASGKLFDTPVVVMSNNSDPEFRRQAMERGASAFLLKSEGAQILVRKAAHMSSRRMSGPRTEPSPAASSLPSPAPLPDAHVRAMQDSLFALLRMTAQTEGLPPQAKRALISAEELAESLLAVLTKPRS